MVIVPEYHTRETRFPYSRLHQSDQFDAAQPQTASHYSVDDCDNVIVFRQSSFLNQLGAKNDRRTSYCTTKIRTYPFAGVKSCKQMKRRANLTLFARRLTPVEVARHWFRRSHDYARHIHSDHPDFPGPGPDGLYLADSVQTWFDGWHGRRQIFSTTSADEEEALEIARGRRHDPPFSD